jgi:hypothetical protein
MHKVKLNKATLHKQPHPRKGRTNLNSLELTSDESEQCLPSEIGLGRAGTTSHVRGWPQASQNYVSRPALASYEAELHLLPRTGLG